MIIEVIIINVSLVVSYRTQLSIKCFNNNNYVTFLLCLDKKMIKKREIKEVKDETKNNK